jgi:hypothetical protein
MKTVNEIVLRFIVRAGPLRGGRNGNQRGWAREYSNKGQHCKGEESDGRRIAAGRNSGLLFTTVVSFWESLKPRFRQKETQERVH